MFQPMSPSGVKILEQYVQHNTEQERTQATSSNTHAHWKDLHI
jgi:hypothetical protein